VCHPDHNRAINPPSQHLQIAGRPTKLWLEMSSKIYLFHISCFSSNNVLMSLVNDMASLYVTSKTTVEGTGGSQTAPVGAYSLTTGAVIAVPADLDEKKLAEARESSAKGSKYLQTSLCRWSPDHKMAASYFQSSAYCYKAAGDLENAKLMYLQVPYDFSCTYTCLTSLHMITR
jgi:hypothetical protein